MIIIIIKNRIYYTSQIHPNYLISLSFLPRLTPFQIQFKSEISATFLNAFKGLRRFERMHLLHEVLRNRTNGNAR